MNFTKLTIGIPKEIMENENRVAATPETVKKMVSLGARVLVEQGAGAGSFFSDEQYAEAGACIEQSAAAVFEQSSLILKVKEPQLNRGTGTHETSLLKKGQCLVCFLHPASPGNRDMLMDLARSGATAFTLDGIPRITRAQSMDALTSMSTVAGYKGVIMAANTLARFVPMVATAAGTVKPSSFLIIGAGVAGLQALATAKRLGGIVSAADIRPDAAEQAKSLGAAIIDTGVPAEAALAQGGYAARLSESLLAIDREKLAPAVAAADVLVLSALVPGRQAPVLVDENMVRSMKPGSVIVDIAVDQGGNCSLTAGGETAARHGVTIIGVKNIPGSVPATSTRLFAENILNFITYLFEKGKLARDASDDIAGSALVARDGQIVHRGALESLHAAREAAS